MRTAILNAQQVELVTEVAERYPGSGVVVEVFEEGEAGPLDGAAGVRIFPQQSYGEPSIQAEFGQRNGMNGG